MTRHVSHVVPVIAAPTGPVRIKPADPGGMQVMGAEAASTGEEKLSPPCRTARAPRAACEAQGRKAIYSRASRGGASGGSTTRSCAEGVGHSGGGPGRTRRRGVDYRSSAQTSPRRQEAPWCSSPPSKVRQRPSRNGAACQRRCRTCSAPAGPEVVRAEVAGSKHLAPSHRRFFEHGQRCRVLRQSPHERRRLLHRGLLMPRFGRRLRGAAQPSDVCSALRLV